MLGACSHLFCGSSVSNPGIHFFQFSLFLVTFSLFSILLLSCFLPLPSTPLPAAPPSTQQAPYAPISHTQSHLTITATLWGGVHCTYMTDEDMVTQKSWIMSWTGLVLKAFSPQSLSFTCFFLSPTSPGLSFYSASLLCLSLPSPTHLPSPGF